MASKSRLQEILENVDDSEVRSYSGRSMYGRKCLGIDTNQSLGKLFCTVLESVEGEEDTRELQEAFSDMRTDAMGLGTIVYFPNIEFYDEDQDSEEEHDCAGPECCTPA